MKTITVSDSYKSMDEFLSIFDETTNIKDLYLTCYQCGCPVYVARDIDNNIALLWHPKKEEDNNFKIVVDKSNILKLFTKDIELPFLPLEIFQEDDLANAYLGEGNIFDEEFKVWERNNGNFIKVDFKLDTSLGTGRVCMKKPSINNINTILKNIISKTYIKN